MLTDFGLSDEYVGVMKGVILTLHPTATIIDISHDIPPQDVSAAARMIRAAFRYFPEKTVHVCVIDPGVGTDRHILAANAGGHRFIAPDNGILFPLLQEAAVETLVRVDNSDFFLPKVSHTFHGRDIFAPVAAHLLRGVSTEALGPPISLQQMVPIELSAPRRFPDGTLVGTVIGADRFGNLLTDIHHLDLDRLAPSGAPFEIQIRDIRLPGLSHAYGAPDAKRCLALIGSRGYLEIAVSGGNAHQCLDVGIGDAIHIRRRKATPSTQ
ncbi:hypothetical protein B2D07_13570 [Desulfococcus multivorans]|nr:hypothetical protein B2D07_13570 [Desulfococcus multivorans]